jgi:hypothetical protein
MGTSASKDKPPSARHPFAHSEAVPPPYQLAIEDMPFAITVLEDRAPREHDGDAALAAATWFSVTLTASTRKRCLYLVQSETDTGFVVLILLFDRTAVTGDDALRIPPNGAWLRAVVDGTVRVLASDLALTRKSITAWIGGRDPITPARPPYT